MRRNNRDPKRESNFTDFSSLRREFQSNNREMHKARCADCGKECEVPFVPKEGRPVYCRDCYPKHKRF
ncbi:DNA-directed RNA polymerase [Candidatus Woesearchaeota archaeon]|nr:DNA-directed RNA polymerase [Candidatus Woesearchaeota archaeon]